MAYRSLLVSHDELAIEILGPVLLEFGIAVEQCSYSAALPRLLEHSYDVVIIDFEDPSSAVAILDHSRMTAGRNTTIAVAVLADRTKVRQVFGAGANFILYHPFSAEQAQALFRAAAALLTRERRRAFRVPLQVPLELRLGNGPGFEGILLDLSEDGMDLLAARPICPTTEIGARFSLPEETAPLEVRALVAWANPNGQSGARFLDLDPELRQRLKLWIQTHAQELPPDEPEAVSECRLSDLSLGGCYVETESPFPERSGVVLSLLAADTEVLAEGMVRVVHPGFGMGIEFAFHGPERDSQVAGFIRLLNSGRATTPELTVKPSALAAEWQEESASARGEWFDPLVELLRRPEEIGQKEFLQELRRQRQREAAAMGATAG